MKQNIQKSFRLESLWFNVFELNWYDNIHLISGEIVLWVNWFFRTNFFFFISNEYISYLQLNYHWFLVIIGANLDSKIQSKFAHYFKYLNKFCTWEKKKLIRGVGPTAHRTRLNFEYSIHLCIVTDVIVPLHVLVNIVFVYCVSFVNVWILFSACVKSDSERVHVYTAIYIISHTVLYVINRRKTEREREWARDYCTA